MRLTNLRYRRREFETHSRVDLDFNSSLYDSGYQVALLLSELIIARKG
jgi:hypothetical protein